MKNLERLLLTLMAAAIPTGPVGAQSIVFRAEGWVFPEVGWFSVPVAGGKVAPLALPSDGPGGRQYGAHGAAWVPNGRTFLLKADGTTPGTELLAVGAPAGSPVTTLSTDLSIPWGFSASPDSRTVAFVASPASGPFAMNVYTVPVAGGVGPTPLTHYDPAVVVNLNSPAYAPGGDRIALLQGVVTDPLTGAQDVQLAVVDAASGATRVLQGGVSDGNYMPSWSPDGARIAAVSATGDVVVVDALGGGVLLQLSSGLFCDDPLFSPDGTTVAALCTSFAAATADLLLFPAGGGAPTVLARDAALGNMGPSWTPDGSAIAYVTDNGAGWQGLTVVGVDGIPNEILPLGPRFNFISTVKVQPAPPVPAVQIATAALDLVRDLLVVEATSPRGRNDRVTLLGHGPMTWSQAGRRWRAVVTGASVTAWTSVGVCGIDGCAYRY